MLRFKKKKKNSANLSNSDITIYACMNIKIHRYFAITVTDTTSFLWNESQWAKDYLLLFKSVKNSILLKILLKKFKSSYVDFMLSLWSLVLIIIWRIIYRRNMWRYAWIEIRLIIFVILVAPSALFEYCR